MENDLQFYKDQFNFWSSGFPFAIICILFVFVLAYAIAVTHSLNKAENKIDSFYNGPKSAKVNRWLFLFLNYLERF